MAKRHHKKQQNKWQPQADDAIKLAAIRWFALMIEAEAIQHYATNASSYSAMEKILRETIAALHDVKQVVPPAVDPGDCPPGYVVCRSECAPMCFEEE